jgi:predicted aspartyl protease
MHHTLHAAARGLALAAALAMAPLTSRSACEIGAIEMPVEMHGSVPVVVLGLNGTPVRLMVNTGTPISILGESVFSRLKLSTRPLPKSRSVIWSTGDKLHARITTVSRVSIGESAIPDMDFAVNLDSPDSQIAGQIGRDFFDVADAEFDLAHGMIRLLFPKGSCENTNLAYWAGDTPVNVVPFATVGTDETDTSFLVDVRVNGMKTRALLSIASFRSHLQLSTAEDAGIAKAGMTPKERSDGTSSGVPHAWNASVDTFELGGERIRNSPITVVDDDWSREGVILGIDYFLSHHILDEALRLDPANAMARADRARARLTAKDREGALADLRTLDAALPPDATERAELARTYADLDLPRDALHQWDLWLQARPQGAARGNGLNVRCWLRVTTNVELDLALADCLEAVALAPGQAAYRDSLGWAYVRRGEFPKAVEAFDRSIALQPESPMSFYGRALAHRAGDAKDAAEADLARARALDPKIDERARRLGLAPR